METPVFLHGHASQLMGIETNRAMAQEESAREELATARRKSYWVVILGLQPMKDGNKWSFIWGNNLQEGVAGFGDTPIDAMAAFERAMQEREDQSP